MNRRQLQLILDLSARIVPGSLPVVMGSQAILGSYPEDQLPAPATMSMEADVAFLDDDDRAKADLVDAILGELTPFHQDHGIYAEGMHVQTAVLPEGWQRRLIAWTDADGAVVGKLLDKHDLAVSKLAAGRPKDHAFVTALLEAALLDPKQLRQRLDAMPSGTHEAARQRAASFIAHHRPVPDAGQIETIDAIVSAAEQADGAAPLDESTWLALRRGRGIRTWVEEDGVALLAGSELNLVVHPDARGRGVGSSLLATVLDAAPADLPLRAWSHIDHPAAARLASAYGFERVRELWVMRRPTSLALPALVLPEDVRIRGFQEADTADLLRLNAASFAAHPEQGAMDEANFADRVSEPWFDPAGLLVAEDATGRMLAFHWTKQHSPDLGEVYVVGVCPSLQGQGLGRLVTLAGLHHLAGLGVSEVILYVESDNAPAIAIYRDKLGFTHAAPDTHVMYERA